MRDEPLERDIVSALDALDYPVRSVRVDTIIQRARVRTRQRRWRFVAAAGVMLAASAAAALPGSPVRRWVVSLLHTADAPARTPTASERAPTAETESTGMYGVVTVVGDSAEVVFSAWQDSGELRIRFVDAAELRIRSATQPAAYQVRPAGVLVNNTGSRASYFLEISSGAANIRVLANGRMIFERRGGRVVMGPRADTGGVYVVSLRRQ